MVPKDLKLYPGWLVKSPPNVFNTFEVLKVGHVYVYGLRQDFYQFFDAKPKNFTFKLRLDQLTHYMEVIRGAATIPNWIAIEWGTRVHG